MPRRMRRIEALQVYELCFRARSTLPFVAYQVIQMIIEHALARTQRDEKLCLCHDIWNGSHAHLIVFTKDAEQCKKFYMELQKKITDCLKRLLGLDYLSIWEGRPMVAKIGDLDEAVKRISYIYANPAQDHLEISIERFPGYSSYKEFLLAMELEISAKCTKRVLRLRLPTFPNLQASPAPSLAQERGLVKLLKKRNQETQPLTRHPNVWMKAYGVREKDAPKVNQRILEQLRRRERIAAMLRKASGKKVLGRVALMKQPILKSHTPKKRERKIFFLSSIRKDRIDFIEEFREFCSRCLECYQQWLLGNLLVEWPPGAFKPPLPPNMNIIPLS